MQHDATPTDNSTSKSLIRRAQQSESAAWEKLSQLYGPVVYGWARKAGLQADDAADLMQSVFAILTTRLAKFEYRNESDRFRGWLYTITRNQIRDHGRRQRDREQAMGGTHSQKIWQELPDSPPHRESDDGLEELEGLRKRALDLVSGDFESRTWQAFWRTSVERDTPQDVAADLGISVWAVYKARSRVLAKLRAEFEELL